MQTPSLIGHIVPATPCINSSLSGPRCPQAVRKGTVWIPSRTWYGISRLPSSPIDHFVAHAGPSSTIAASMSAATMPMWLGAKRSSVPFIGRSDYAKSSTMDRPAVDVDRLPGYEASLLRAQPHGAGADPSRVAQLSHRNRTQRAWPGVVGVLPVGGIFHQARGDRVDAHSIPRLLDRDVSESPFDSGLAATVDRVTSEDPA